MIARIRTAIASAERSSRYRRDYKQLMSWSDAQLRDIGLTRDAVRYAAHELRNHRGGTFYF